MSELHLAEVEKTLLYVSEARERAARACAVLEKEHAAEHLVSALRTTEAAMAAEHRRLLHAAFHVVTDEQESLAV